MFQLKAKLNRLKLRHGVSYYLLFTFGEVSLIVLGILMALQFDNWDKDQEFREIERQYYQDLATQLHDDKHELLGTIEYSNSFRVQYVQALHIIATDDQSRQSDLAKYALNLKSYSDFRRKSTVYQTLVSSGDIKHIQNKKLIAMLQNLESEYSYIERMEDIHRDVILDIIFPSFLIKAIRISDLSLVEPKILYNYQFENIVIVTVGLMDEKTDIYKNAIAEIDVILAQIKSQDNNK
jgi:hypothetical protein